MIHVKLIMLCDECGKEATKEFDCKQHAYAVGGVPQNCSCGGNMRIYKRVEELIL
jgi:hypothetical protein